MSRIGNNPITLKSGVEFKADNGVITVKGSKGELVQPYDAEAVNIQIEGETITLVRTSDHKDVRSKHGLYRALVFNMIEGVSVGWTKKLEFHGVGYRATANGNLLEMTVGYSHAIVLEMPAEIKMTAEAEKGKPPVVTLESHDKQLLGQVAAKIRAYRKPEPYKGKGIRYVGEYIRRKAGKSAAK